ncbi:MAG: GNAT family N-acetyltransferase [Lachnospiraceae bacterium]|nr:GNAT family N-acetyltransferase [Lachnospiraceae bacterium]
MLSDGVKYAGNRQLKIREICKDDDAILAGIIRSNLKKYGLDIPGTAYFDDNLDHLSDFYLADKEKRYYFIALECDEIIGGIGLAELEYFDDCAELQKLYLADDAKGRGIGYTLIRMVEDKARELGYRRIYLETHSNLAAAIHIYERSGYREIEKPSGVVHATMDRFFIKDL